MAMPLDPMTIMKTCYESERSRVVDKARDLARELESSAKMIAKAVEEGDLNRIAWLTRLHDVELSTRATVLHEHLHMLVGLEDVAVERLKQMFTAPNGGCYCDYLREGKYPTPCATCVSRQKGTQP